MKKKIIGIIFISLMFCNIGFAEMRLIKYDAVGPTDAGDYFMLAKICVEGYKFVITGDTSSIVQAFEERDGKSLPAKC